ncbi:MAG: class I SAM-dependent methyltransferase [Deltaproteobacteria bacterium]|nr:class I SAM-dependent methyltransferase [Deltaproteobacteria bacterium]
MSRRARGGRAPEKSAALSALQQTVVAHYESRLARFGATARGMDWKDEASQRLRFELLCGICSLDGQSVHEVGAGAGHLADFMEVTERGADYSGSDLSAAMVEAARGRRPDLRFEQRDVLEGPVREEYDVLLCSGLFHVKLEQSEEAWRAFVEAMVRRMFGMCRVGIAFNLMSDRVDYRDPALYYASPARMLAFCRESLGPHVALRHDYPLYEYTVYAYKQPAGHRSAGHGSKGRAAQPERDHAGPERGG